MKSHITGKWRRNSLFDKEYALKKEAREDFKGFCSGADNSRLYIKALPKESGCEFAKLLLSKGVFNLQFDDSERDWFIFYDIAFLLNNRKEFKLPDWFTQRLKNIEKFKFLWSRTKIIQDEIDLDILSFIKHHGFENFIKAILEIIDSLDWPVAGKKMVNLSKEFKLAEVASASYLIKRGYLLTNGKPFSCEQDDSFDIKKTFKETKKFLYIKQKIFEGCYFGAFCSSGILYSCFDFLNSKKGVETGLLFDGFYQLENNRNANKLSLEKPPSYEDLKKLIDDLIAIEAKSYGIPSESYLDYYFYKSLTFRDLENIYFVCAKIMAISFLTNKKKISSEDFRKELLLRFKNRDKSDLIYELIVCDPCHIMDLYQTPFIDIAGTLYFSYSLLKHNNYPRNIATAAYKTTKKKGTSSESQKGVLFEKQVQSILKKKIENVFQGIKFSTNYGDNILEGDIDVIVREDDEIHVLECKAEMTPMDYFDYRRDKDILSTATYQLTKIMLYLSTNEGKSKIGELFGDSAVSLPIFPGIVISNSRTACLESTEFPIYSFYEIEMAINGGNLLLVQEELVAKRKIKGVFANLEKKTVSNILFNATRKYDNYQCLPPFRLYRFEEFRLDWSKAQKSFSKEYYDFPFYPKKHAKISDKKLYAILVVLFVLLQPFVIALIRWIINQIINF